MDISSYQVADEPRPLKILHPITNEETDITVFCISPDHSDYKGRAVEAVREGLDPAKKVDVSDVVDRKPEIIAAMVTGWEGIQVNGKAMKYTKANAVKLMKEYPWIQSQIDRFCGQRANFFKGSVKD